MTALGSTVAGYRIDALIGRGGMGVVYRATDLSLDRPVALKLIAPELAQDERFRRRFLKEPRLAAALDHPNVVPIYEAGEDDGRLYLAMRYVEGTDLKRALAAETALTPHHALTVLAQVASALDRAHRRGLVHRDVKPANILLGEDDHAYLTDFGVSKEAGAGSTETGQMVGTLDYMAPEQIRGEPVDGRSDVYSLGCVLYECVSGAPPFRRPAQAATMWAQLQEPPPPLRRHGALDPVIAQALAKEPAERYATCAELIDAAQAALGIAGPAAVRERRSLPWRRALVVTGIAAAVAVAVTLWTGRDKELGVPTGNGVAAIGPAGDRIASFAATRTAPSHIAVGEGAVWMLNTENATVSRIDPETRKVTAAFTTPGVPTAIAAGEGALWIGNGGGDGANFTLSVSRVDPRTRRVTHTVKLPDRVGDAAIATYNEGQPDVVVGAGAVWTRNPDLTVSRLDPATGEIVETIDVVAGRIAAGPEGVWVVDGGNVTPIDPSTNRPGETFQVDAQAASSIAVGGGSVWVAAWRDGVVWRIEPGPRPVTRSIAVAPGVAFVAYGAGALWAGNYLDGTLARIDPRTNAIVRVPVGAVQALAAGPSGAWVSTAGRPDDGTLPPDVCGEVVSGGGRPDVLIASDLPLQGPDSAGPKAIDDAIRLVLKRRGHQAGEFTVGYRACDASTAQSGATEERRCAANGNAYAQADDLVAVIGPWSSFCAQVQIPILNRASGGPLAMISPTNTYPGLTREGLTGPGGYRGEPEVYYPTGIRNFVRLMPGDDLQGAAYAALADELELGRVFVLSEQSSFWEGLLADPFRRAADKLGVAVAGSATYDPRAQSYAKLAGEVARSGARGVLVGGNPADGGDRLLEALRARLGDHVTFMLGFFFTPEATLARVDDTAHGMYTTTSDLPRATLPLNDTGRRVARELGTQATQFQGVLEAAQATELVLDAIASSNGSRASVRAALAGAEVRDGILGSFRFDHDGDITPASVPILKITGDSASDLPPGFEGAVVDRVVAVPADLLG